MTGTGELHTADGNGKLAVLLDRSEATQEFMRNATAALGRIEHTQIESITELRGRSDTNHVAIGREEVSRLAADDMLNKKHDEDVAEINVKIDAITSKLGDVFVTNRIILFLTAAIVVAVIAGVVSGHISLVVHP